MNITINLFHRNERDVYFCDMEIAPVESICRRGVIIAAIASVVITGSLYFRIAKPPHRRVIAQSTPVPDPVFVDLSARTSAPPRITEAAPQSFTFFPANGRQ